MADAPAEGLEGFIAGLRRCGCDAVIRDNVVTFAVVPVEGGRAGQPTETGVGIEELASWPATPPHWVHLPSEVRFERSNTQPSSIAGWIKHSRQIQGWGNAKEPAQAWISHVRSVIGVAL